MSPKDIFTRKVVEGDTILHLESGKKFILKLAMDKGVNGEMWLMGGDGEMYDARECECVS